MAGVVGVRSAAAPAVGALVLIVIAAPNFLAPMRPFDAGIASSAATFTLHGLVPYRDYWFLYGPLSAAFLSIPAALLGPSLELTRTIGLLLLSVEVGAAFFILRRWVATGPALAIAIAAVAMYPAILGLEVSAWLLSCMLALIGLSLAVSARRGGWLIGAVVGLAALARPDVGVYCLAAILILDGRRQTVTAFAVLTVPFYMILIASTELGSLVEQLIWYPIVGPRQFRGLPGPEAVIGQPAAAILSVPLLLLPRLAITAAVLALVAARYFGWRSPDPRPVLAVVVFSLLCQLQTLGRADIEHLTQAATPALLLLAVPYAAARPGLIRFTSMAAATAMCLVVALLGVRHFWSPDLPLRDRAIFTVAAWVREATAPGEPIFVGLTSHRYTFDNPLLVYYLADRATGVHDAMFNPGVTNTEWGQTRMVLDLDQSATRILVLDRTHADIREESNDSRFPGSTLLDSYIAARFRVLCDLNELVIMSPIGTNRSEFPPCPPVAP